MLAKEPCIVGAAIDCVREEESVFLDYESKSSSPLFLHSCPEGSGFMVAVKNFTKKKGSCTIRVPEREIVSAEITDVQGKTKQILDISRNSIVFEQEPAAITLLRISLKASGQ